MNKILLILGFIAAMLFVSPVAPANAGVCAGGVLCGQIKHYSPDDGYDDPILIRCNYGDALTNHLLYEGESSSKYCKDTDQVFVRDNEEIWCKELSWVDSYGIQHWYWQREFDAWGWHKINDIWDDGQGCTLRRD